jgi:hypothetical protein
MVARAVLIIPPFFCFSKREGEERGLVLGHSLILWLLLAGGGHCMGQDPQALVSWWGPHSSLLDGFGEVDIPGGTAG